MSLFSILRRLRIISAYDAHQIIEAETENVMRDHGIAMTRVESSRNGVRQSEGRLLESIQHVRTSSESAQRQPDAMAQFVRDMRSSGHHRQRN